MVRVRVRVKARNVDVFYSYYFQPLRLMVLVTVMHREWRNTRKNDNCRENILIFFGYSIERAVLFCSRFITIRK